jgi:hypothetical protein
MHLSMRSASLCANCRTDRYELRARGYCVRCYRLVLKKDAIRKWNLKDPSSLKYYPSAYRPEQYLKIIKKGFIAQLEQRLSFLRHREDQRINGADGMTIEWMLNNLARRAGAKDDVYGVATLIDHTFPPEQKQVLFQLLNDIEEKIRRRDLDIARILEKQHTST